MKKTMLVILLLISAVVADPLYLMYRKAMDSTEVVSQNFEPFTFKPTATAKQDSASPINYSTELKDVYGLCISPTMLPHASYGGWSLMTWVRFDNSILSNTKNIPVFECAEAFRLSISASGKQILFQTPDSFANGQEFNQDTLFPYTFKSDTLASLFDGYFHLVSVTYTDATNKYMVCVDGKVIADQTPTTGVAVKTPVQYTMPFTIGTYWAPVAGQGNWYRAPAGFYMAGFELLSRPMTATAHKTHYDTTIVHAYKHRPTTTLEKTNMPHTAITVYPNPCNSTLNWTGYANEAVLYTSAGQQISITNKMSVKTLPNGMYLLHVKTNTGYQNTKVFILH